ncbi:MAG: hypothetical protein C0490_12695, partial [Marivirga sp.]|nr:hypothetical protein [Marivirga sp.]
MNNIGNLKYLLLVILLSLGLEGQAQIVPPPDVPTMSINTCGPKILTRGTPPENITWYWVGTDPNGTSTNSDLTYTVNSANSVLYYLRAKSGSDWSVAVGVKVTTDPIDLVLNAYDVPEVQASHSITLSAGFTVPAGKTFTARIGVSSECNDLYNWTEQISYGQDGEPIARSKVFADGFGQVLQSQSIDYASQKVWVSQPVYDNLNQPSIVSLPAPILESDFIYKKNFITSSVTGEAYGPSDFDKPIESNALGEVNNPIGVGVQPGTLGWYYSSSNNLEPATPVTNFPYSRSYTKPGPDPVKTESSGPGDAYKMGSGHQVAGERHTFIKSELSHYFDLRSHFVATPLPVSQNEGNLLLNFDGASLTGYTASQNVALSLVSQNDESYVKVITNEDTGTPGVFPIGISAISVTPGFTYTFRVKGYRSSANQVS